MEPLQQIVIQINNGPYERGLAQYGSGLIVSNQIEIVYSDLTPEEKITWDAFIDLIKTKQ
jgi:hypothetical protein